MNAALLLDKFAQKTEKLGSNKPHVSGEFILQGSRVEILFIPEIPRNDEEKIVRDGVVEAIQTACAAESQGAHKVDAQLGHLALADITSGDIGAISSLPGVVFKQTVV